MRFYPLILVVCCLALAACATPESRRELTGPYYPFKPIPYKAPTPGETTFASPSETTTWYGPDTRNQITGRWGMAGHYPDLNYPQAPCGIKQRVIARNNIKGLRAQQIANRTLASR